MPDQRGHLARQPPAADEAFHNVNARGDLKWTGPQILMIRPILSPQARASFAPGPSPSIQLL